MVPAQYDRALMQKLLAENSAEQIAATSARIEWGDRALAEEVQDLLERSIPRPRLGNTWSPPNLTLQPTPPRVAPWGDHIFRPKISKNELQAGNLMFNCSFLQSHSIWARSTGMIYGEYGTDIFWDVFNIYLH